MADEKLDTLQITPLLSYVPPDHPFEVRQNELNADNALEQLVLQYIPAAKFFVAYLDYGVRIGRCENEQFRLSNNEHLHPEYLQRLRAFNSDEELFLWRTSTGFRGRLRQDKHLEGAESVEVVEAHQVLWGTKKSSLDEGNFTEIWEDRGTRLILPFPKNQFTITERQQRICIKTRNYIDYYQETGQATYVDCRFVSFTDGQKDLEERGD